VVSDIARAIDLISNGMSLVTRALSGRSRQSEKALMQT